MSSFLESKVYKQIYIKKSATYLFTKKCTVYK